MAITHRKLLQNQDSNQNSTCSDCGPICRYKCSYPEFYWPRQPPPTPQHTTTTTTHISPYAIIIVTLLASAFLFFSYYLIMVRCSNRFRRAPSTPISRQDDNFLDQDNLEVDHPIWYINTIGLQPSVINSISVFKYKKHDNVIDGTDCSVCLSEFQDNDILRLLPKCNHAFHIPCIDTWLRSHTNCPLCRAGILSNNLSAVLSSNDHNNFPTPNGLSDSNLQTQVGNLENDGGSGGNVVQEIEDCDENEDSKTEYESVMAARSSISVESVAIADIIVEESEE